MGFSPTKLLMSVLLLAHSAFAQNKPEDAMAASLARQRESVQRQATAATGMAPPAVDSFFTVAWPGPPTLPDAGCPAMTRKELEPVVSEAAAREKVSADLIHAVIAQESGGKPCAVSVKGAMGLMQLMPETADELQVPDPFDPSQSVGAGTKRLKQLLEKYKGDVSLALSAYNAGERRVDEAGGIPPIPETQNYVKSISGKLNSSGSSDPPSPR